MSKATKSINTIGNLQIDSAQDSTHNPENYFSVTSDEKANKFNLIPSVVSLGTENSIYSHQPKENEEFNLYCVDESHPANSSNSQMDIIYNKQKYKKRKANQTTNSRQPPKEKRKLFSGKSLKSRSIKGFKSSFKQKRLKKHSFQNNLNN